MPGSWSVSRTTRACAYATSPPGWGLRSAAYAIVTDLTAAGYVVKEKDNDGRRNRYQIQTHLPLPESLGRERTIGEVLDVLVDSTRKPVRRPSRSTPSGSQSVRKPVAVKATR